MRTHSPPASVHRIKQRLAGGISKVRGDGESDFKGPLILVQGGEGQPELQSQDFLLPPSEASLCAFLMKDEKDERNK